MLNTNLNRNPISVPVRIAIAAAALTIAIAIAGSGAAAQTVSSSLSGAFVDALDRAIADVSLTLTNNQTGEKYSIRSDADGRFTFSDLPDGDYRGEATAIGFMPVHPFFRISQGKTTSQTLIPLPLGTIEETITVSSQTVGERVDTLTARFAQELERLRMRRQRAPAEGIQPPLKVRDVPPVYPQNRTADEATIFLEGVIDTNGLMKGLQVLQPADAAFATAAMEAVNEWQFEPTRLHGVLVDTGIHITVRFVH